MEKKNMHLWYGQVSSHSVCVVINSPTSEAIFSMFYAQHLSRRHTQQWAPGQEWHHSFCDVTVNVDEGLLGAKRWHCWWQTLSSFQRGGLIGRLNLSFKHNSRELNEAKTQSLWLRPWRAKEMDSIQCNTNRKGSGTLLKPTPNNKKYLPYRKISQSTKGNERHVLSSNTTGLHVSPWGQWKHHHMC